LKKWTASLRKKKTAFPLLYDFGDILEEPTILGMTEKLLPKYSEFSDMETYFKAYGINRHDLEHCPVPISLITAADDGIIPVADALGLKLNHNARLIIHQHGGHNGFFQSLNGPTWYDDYIRQVMKEAVA